MEFDFSIFSALKRSWAIFKKHALFFLTFSVVMVILNFFSKKSDSGLIEIIAGVAGMVWSYIGMSIALAAVDGKEQMLTFDSLKLHLPSFKQFLKLLGVSIASIIVITAGFIMLIIPGIYFAIRLIFSSLVLVDKRGKVIESMRTSWRLVKGEIFWTVLLGVIIAVALVVVGLLVLLVGALVTYPIALLFMAFLYRELTNYHSSQVVTEQPKEIPAATSETQKTATA